MWWLVCGQRATLHLWPGSRDGCRHSAHFCLLPLFIQSRTTAYSLELPTFRESSSTSFNPAWKGSEVCFHGGSKPGQVDGEDERTIRGILSGQWVFADTMRQVRWDGGCCAITGNPNWEEGREHSLPLEKIDPVDSRLGPPVSSTVRDEISAA